jgi:HEAT repeat protein
MILTQICRLITMAGHAGDRKTVVDGLSHDAAEVRVVALGAALRVGELDEERLLAALEDSAVTVRYRAIELIARMPFNSTLAERAIAALQDPDLREVAAFVLGELPLDGELLERAIAALGSQATGDEDALARESAVAALGALGGGLNFILTATGDVATVRRRAVLALAPFDGPEVDAVLQEALTDRDWQVRQAAEDLLE